MGLSAATMVSTLNFLTIDAISQLATYWEFDQFARQMGLFLQKVNG
jgi:hypothetical protein